MKKIVSIYLSNSIVRSYHFEFQTYHDIYIFYQYSVPQKRVFWFTAFIESEYESKYLVKGAHRERNQPVPVRGFKPFCYRALNICSKIRGGAKNNQCHGTVALARWAPLDILDTKVRLVSVFRYRYLTLKRDWDWDLISKIIGLPLVSSIIIVLL